MNDAEGRIAIADLVDEHADRVDVVDLGELGGLSLHLLVNAVDVLRAPLEIRLDPGRFEARLELGDGPGDVVLAALPTRVEKASKLPEALGLEHLEGEVLQLPFDLPDAEALREWRVDLLGLTRDPDLLL